MHARIWKFLGLPDFFSDALPRGICLFFSAFSLLNLIGNYRVPGFDANLWWIDLRFLPKNAADIVLAIVSVVFAAFAVRPPIAQARQATTAVCAAVVATLAGINTVSYYKELYHGAIRSSVPIPLSLFICAAFVFVLRASLRTRTSALNTSHVLGVLFATVLCILLFPVLQVLCFGNTDYRRQADAIVVLGARAYADGRPSDALADRVRTAVDLYKEGLAKKIIMSGGPGDGAVHETEAMRQFAVKLGVATEDILKDEQGLNTQLTVANTSPILKQLNASRVLVVSHFYHLPRIKMAYQRNGWDVYTVPAKQAYFLREIPYMVAREVAGLWVYYVRPLRCPCEDTN